MACAACRHPKVAAIDAGIDAKTPVRELSETYGIPKSTIWDHKRHRDAEVVLAQRLAKEVRTLGRSGRTPGQVVEEAANRIERHADRIEKILVPVEKMLRACDRWLTDPDDPDEYDLSPRGYEVDVIYEEADGDRTVRRKAKLSELLARVQGAGIADGATVEIRIADTRDLTLKTAAEARGGLEAIARVLGILKPDAAPALQVNVFAAPVWVKVEQLVLDVIGDDAERRSRFVKGLLAMRAGKADDA